MTLIEKLDLHARDGALPMHMPGHKRNAVAFPWLRGLAERDITEIRGFDDLNDPEGLFADLERRAARLWGAGESAVLVNGSTLGILASVMACLEGGGEILMCRDSHRSVYNGAFLASAETRYIWPKRDPELGIPLSVTPEQVSTALDEHPGVGLVCVTSPTYEGVISDIQGIAAACHAHGAPLLVDAAHGAHLGFGAFPPGPVGNGADIAVMSLHKTLPALTQTAILHMDGNLVDRRKVRRYVAMLQSSSPSYLLSASADACVDFLEREGRAAADRWLSALAGFRAGAGELKNIRLWRGAQGVYGLDPSKLLLCGGAGLGDRLRGLNIEPEYARGGAALCMTGMGDGPESLGRLLEALRALDGDGPGERVPAAATRARPPELAMPIFEAARLPGRPVPLDAALGRVSGEYAWVYPPGTPFVVPGEVVDEDAVRMMKSAQGVRTTHKHGPDSIFCVDLPGEI